MPALNLSSFHFLNIFLTHSAAHSNTRNYYISDLLFHNTIKSTKTLTIHLTMTVPTSCCGRSGQSCVCASKAKCSCGKQSALQCNCEKAKTENVVAGARCSCRKPTSHLYALSPRILVSNSGVQLRVVHLIRSQCVYIDRSSLYRRSSSWPMHL